MFKRSLSAILLAFILLFSSVLPASGLSEPHDPYAAIPLPAYARLLHDSQWMGYPSRSAAPGWGGLPSPPETVPFSVAPKRGGGKDDVKLTQLWQDYLADLNSERSLKFILEPSAGWFNANTAADSLGFGGNVVLVDEIVGKWAKIQAFKVSDSPPDAKEVNFQTAPFLVHKFTVTTKFGQIINPGRGLDVYIFLIAHNDLYVPLERLEFFPAPPLTVTVNFWTGPWLNLRSCGSRSCPVTGGLQPGQQVELSGPESYLPQGSNVWGRLGDGWGALLYHPKPWYLKYYTDWRMQTLPPLPPAAN